MKKRECLEVFWWVGLLVTILSCPTAKLPAVKREGRRRCPGVSNTGPKADPQLADVSKTSQNRVFSSLPGGCWWGWTTQGWIFSCCCQLQLSVDEVSAFPARFAQVCSLLQWTWSVSWPDAIPRTTFPWLRSSSSWWRRQPIIGFSLKL